jgi:hypothetical protein
MQLEPAALDREFEARAAVLGPAPAVDKQKRTVDPFDLDAALNRLDHVSDFNGSARAFSGWIGVRADGGVFHAAALSSLSTPRATILIASSGSGRCSRGKMSAENLRIG